ncbi:hypothetical protein J6590_062351 [Homalodisca vitripennis]|nr:hypothetical protein J6590_062351 [Homalodisca vitripennis]
MAIGASSPVVAVYLSDNGPGSRPTDNLIRLFRGVCTRCVTTATCVHPVRGYSTRREASAHLHQLFV